MSPVARIVSKVEPLPSPKRQRIYRSLAAHLVRTAASTEALAARIARARYPLALAVSVASEALRPH
jgi:hypothetical protein